MVSAIWWPRRRQSSKGRADEFCCATQGPSQKLVCWSKAGNRRSSRNGRKRFRKPSSARLALRAQNQEPDGYKQMSKARTLARQRVLSRHGAARAACSNLCLEHVDSQFVQARIGFGRTLTSYWRFLLAALGKQGQTGAI